ncbi:helix-turn-helix transcriptional regulator [Sulfitobacter albidus]|uniref:Helix-turn-helix transcriptional regulator n=2 Tax=Sulfitobacter albidus TaxID=2829501 RepID=A0A975JGN4_9RHOB|nr:helix-turn-helix transcriptional regulator [Sulfitobacter albidus]
MFGANLRSLSAPFGSVSKLSRELGINRTQLNRYLSGESFPRPDVLARICSFFDVDARVLLEPIDSLPRTKDAGEDPFVADFLGAGERHIPQAHLPDGFYRVLRRSFSREDRFHSVLVRICRVGARTYLRGFAPISALPRDAMVRSTSAREFRGRVMSQGDGLSIMMTGQNGTDAVFNYLRKMPSHRNNLWLGYAVRSVPEHAAGERVTRTLYEYLGNRISDGLTAGRRAGPLGIDDLLPTQLRLLRPDTAFH